MNSHPSRQGMVSLLPSCPSYHLLFTQQPEQPFQRVSHILPPHVQSPSMDSPGGPSGKEPGYQCRNPKRRSSPGSGRSPGGGHGNPLQSSCLENPHGQRCLVGYSSWGRKESDTAERLSTAQHAPYDTTFLLEYLYPWVSKKQTFH